MKRSRFKMKKKTIPLFKIKRKDSQRYSFYARCYRVLVTYFFLLNQLGQVKKKYKYFYNLSILSVKLLKKKIVKTWHVVFALSQVYPELREKIGPAACHKTPKEIRRKLDTKP